MSELLRVYSRRMARAKTSVAKSKAKKSTKKAPAKKSVAKKSPAKKAPAKKSVAKKSPAKKAPAKKSVAKKSPAKKSVAKKAPAKKTKNKSSLGMPELFEPLTEGERAESLRLLLEDDRLASMAKIGRYRVIAVEPLALKPNHKLGNHRLARIVIYDYAADRCVEANIDLDEYCVQYLSLSKSQPMLAAEEENAAMEIAISDARVQAELALGEIPISAMHYWSHRPAELAYNRRSAAVLLGAQGRRPSLVAIVDLLDATVSDVVSAENW